MANRIIGQKIRELRMKTGITQKQIAQFLGVDQRTISKCEKGELQFRVDHLERLGQLFGIPLGTLMNEEIPLVNLNITFGADVVQAEDLNAIADIQKIALNLDQMQNFLHKNKAEVDFKL
jgi:transcriptional regulator with XRE-family HTH domain